MNCKNCGNELPENASRCDSCGANVETAKNVVFDGVVLADENKRKAQRSQGTGILVYSILSLVFAFCFSPVGLVFAIISKAKYGSYKKHGGEPTRATNAAKILSTIGLILSICVFIVSVIIIVVWGLVSIINFIASLLIWFVSFLGTLVVPLLEFIGISAGIITAVVTAIAAFAPFLAGIIEAIEEVIAQLMM